MIDCSFDSNMEISLTCLSIFYSIFQNLISIATLIRAGSDSSSSTMNQFQKLSNEVWIFFIRWRGMGHWHNFLVFLKYISKQVFFSILPLFIIQKHFASAKVEQKQTRVAHNCGTMGLYELQICCIFLQSNYPEYPGIGKDFPRMTFGEFPGKFPIGKSPGNITIWK